MFTITTRGLQFRLLAHMAALVFTEKDNGKGVSSFRALALFAGGPACRIERALDQH